MAAGVTLTLTQAQHRALQAHLFPSDGLEAVAILLCGRHHGKKRHRLIVHRIVEIPYSQCTDRQADRVTWPTSILLPLLEEAGRKGWGIVKIHGHTSYGNFSATDDVADRQLVPSLHAWLDSDAPNGSAIMMADGSMFGRVVTPQGLFKQFACVSVVGDDIRQWRSGAGTGGTVPEFARRIAQTFGKGTFELLRTLKIGVVGCSGTGSPVVEMLARNCVGDLVLVDPDVIEEKNLNRIFNSRMADADAKRSKVEALASAIDSMGLGVRVETFAQSLFDPEVISALADCDVLFGCMDTVDGRQLLNRLATFYAIPYLDLGVKLVSDGAGSVDQVCGTVHYLKPGGSSLLSRKVYTLEQVRAAGLARTDPEAYARNIADGYIQGVAEDRPAVIQLNTLIAAYAVNELLARLHPYRLDPNGDYASHRISLSHGIYEHETDGEPCLALARHVGRGDTDPLLDWPELSRQKAV